MKTISAHLLSFCLLLVSTSAFATSRMLPEKSWYQVEIIVFTPSDQLPTNETWVSPFLQFFTPSKTLRMQQPLWLGEEAQQLQTAQQKLENKGYTILLHQVWQQAVTRPRLAKAVPINNDENVQGSLRLSQTNYINATLDLKLDVDGDNFQLKQKRRLRVGELHYIDHPLAGVLLFITEVQPS